MDKSIFPFLSDERSLPVQGCASVSDLPYCSPSDGPLVVVGGDKGGVFELSQGETQDNLSVFNLSNSSFQWINRFTPFVSVKHFGAKGDGVTDDTAAIQAAVDFCAGQAASLSYLLPTAVSSLGSFLHFPKGKYLTGKITWKTGVKGFGSAGAVLFLKNGEDTEVVYISNISNFGLSGLVIDGNKANQSAGDGINFANTSAVGGNFEISNLTIQSCKGNGINATGSSSGGGSFFNNIRISDCDGVGFYNFALNDIKFNGGDIRLCKTGGMYLGNVKANILSNIKCWKNRVSSSTATNIIPASATEAEDAAAVILCGHTHSISNLEAQENGSIGVRIGTSEYGLYNSSIKGLVVDGNGGYDPGADAGTQSNYRRDGIQLVNYYNVLISGIADDFRARQNKGRQKKGIKTIGTLATKTSGQLRTDQWFKITDNSGGADFTNLQLSLASPSNDVGHIFQVQTNDYSNAEPTSWGTGELAVVNDFAHIEMFISNQYEQNQGTGTGYDFSTDGGNSLLRVNSSKVSTPNRIEVSSTINIGTVNAQTHTDYNVTVTGARAGHAVNVTSRNPLTNGLITCNPHVSANDTITFAIQNVLTSTNITMGNNTFDVVVFIP